MEAATASDSLNLFVAKVIYLFIYLFIYYEYAVSINACRKSTKTQNHNTNRK